MIASKVRPEATTGSVLLKKAPLKFYEIETPVTESLFKSSCRPQAQLFAANFVKFFEIFYVANVLLWQRTFLIDWCLKRLKSTIYLLLFYREHFHGFSESDLWKCRKKKHSFHNRHINIGHLHIQATDILKFYEFLFCTYCKGFFCL